jgi:hypothetical protein
MTVLVIPLVIAVVGAIVAFVLPLLFPSSPASSGALGVDALVVSNPTDAQVDAAIGTVSFPAKLPERTKPTIELKLHNDSDQPVDLTAARFVVLGYARIDACVEAAALPLSGNYDILLPADPRPGVSVTSNLNEEVPPHGLDRFRFRLDAPFASYGGGGQDTVLYRLEVQLLHDGSPKPFTVGVVTLSFPGALNPGDYSLFWDETTARLHAAQVKLTGGPGATGCDHANTGLLSKLLVEPGVRSPELERLARDVGA